jgi:hypothetical protein
MNARALLLGGLRAAAPAAAGAQELGRLFFTPDQRAALDARRKARVPDKPAAVPQAIQPVTRVDGAVRRSGGRSTVFVDGEPVQESPRADGARPTKGPDADRVSIPTGEEQRLELRVGETLDRNSGEVRDVVGKDSVKVKPRGAAGAK